MNVHVIIIIVIIKFIDVNLNVSDYYKIMNPPHTIVIITKPNIINNLLYTRIILCTSLTSAFFSSIVKDVAIMRF